MAERNEFNKSAKSAYDADVLVFPAASRPNMSNLISLFPNNLPAIQDSRLISSARWQPVWSSDACSPRAFERLAPILLFVVELKECGMKERRE